MNSNLIDTNLFLMVLGWYVVFLGLGLAIYGIYTWTKSEKRISTRLDQYVNPEVQSPSDSTTNQVVPREISGSLFRRTIINWLKNLLHLLGKYTPKKMAVDMEHKLTIAGNPANLRAGDFYAIQILLFITGIVFAYFINRDFKNINTTSLLLGAFIIVICLMYPNVWLRGRIRSRQDEIRRGLPDALDMLSVCASAGLGFDQSLQKISGYWETELGHEIKRVTQEMEMGVPRGIALRHMANRLDVDDLTRFVAIIIQAEKVGMSYADVLHSQALQMRVLRQYRAREVANKLPAKMIFPIAMLIFPAMLAVILGPSIPTLMNIF